MSDAGRNELILIVEDNDRNRKLLRDVLQVSGYRTIESESGEEGLRLAREQHPALILMDIHLGGISGIEALRALRADDETSDIPVVAATAAAMGHEREQFLAAGFDAFQPKPMNIRGLLDCVRGLLPDRRRAQ